MDSKLVVAGLIASGAVWLLGIIGWLFRGLLTRRFKNGDLVENLLLTARWSGFVWLFLFFMRYEYIQPFQLRIWVYIAFIPLIIWLVYIVRRTRLVIPLQVQAKTRYNHYDKYLPSANRKTSGPK